MADMGFLPEVKRILDQVRADRQTLLFSATLDGDVDVLVSRYQRDPERCEVESDEAEIDRTTHHFLRAKREHRVNMAADLVAEHGSTVVFCRTKHGADRVARQLARAGVSTVAIHGGRSQSQRDRALASFAAGRVQALVATDVAARGIHVDDVRCVLHFDVAGDHKDYVHRSGRTGRAGAQGVVVSFVTETDTAKVRALRRALDLPRDATAGGSDGGGAAAPSRHRQPERTGAKGPNASQRRRRRRRRGRATG
jgi:superfamily II DNA/RNA helicase